MTGGRGAPRARRWTELGAGDAAAPAMRGGRAPHANAPARQRTRRAAARASVGALMSILRLEGVHREVGDVRDPRLGSMPPSRSATGSGWSARTAPARRRCSGSPPGSTSPTRATVTRKRDLSIGLLAQEAHLDDGFMAAPDLRTAVRPGAAHLEAMAAELPSSSALGSRRPSRPTRTCSTGSRPSAATRSTSASTRRCPGSASSRDDWAEPPTRAVGRRADARGARPARDRRAGPAAARRADEPPRPRRARVARGAPPPARRARCSSRRTTARSSTRPSPASGSSATGG